MQTKPRDHRIVFLSGHAEALTSANDRRFWVVETNAPQARERRLDDGTRNLLVRAHLAASAARFEATGDAA